jgi:hypothetical protein
MRWTSNRDATKMTERQKVSEWLETRTSGLSPNVVVMGELFQRIVELVDNDRYVVGQHASERFEERGIMEWQVVVGLSSGN